MSLIVKSRCWGKKVLRHPHCADDEKHGWYAGYMGSVIVYYTVTCVSVSLSAHFAPYHSTGIHCAPDTSRDKKISHKHLTTVAFYILSELLVCSHVSRCREPFSSTMTFFDFGNSLPVAFSSLIMYIIRDAILERESTFTIVLALCPAPYHFTVWKRTGNCSRQNICQAHGSEMYSWNFRAGLFPFFVLTLTSLNTLCVPGDSFSCYLMCSEVISVLYPLYEQLLPRIVLWQKVYWLRRS